MKTFKPSDIARLFNDEFNAGALTPDFDSIKALAVIDPDEVQVLIERLESFKSAAINARESVNADVNNALNDLIKNNSLLAKFSKEDLISIMAGGHVVPKNQTSAKSITKPDTSWTVYIKSEDGNSTDQIKVTNPAVQPPKRLLEHPVFAKQAKNYQYTNSNGELVFDTVQILTDFSPEYAKSNPANAVFESEVFCINNGGQIGGRNKLRFDKWKKKHPDGTASEFRQSVKDAFSTKGK